MSLWRSPIGGQALLGWRRIGLVAAGFGLVPGLLGAVGLLAMQVLGSPASETARLAQAMATLAFLSPLLLLPFFALAGLAGWALMRRGYFGALPAAALGLLAGLGIAQTTGAGIAVLFGAAAMLLFRQVLAVMKPMAI